MKTLEELMTDGKYLPDFMRDFHAQKLVFKVIGRIVDRQQNNPDYPVKELPNWMLAHIYVIDFFLWFMARRGYTLQRCRAKIKFLDIADDFSEYQEYEKQMFDKYMKEKNGY